MSISLKRPRSPSLSNESKADAFDLISSDLSLYLLSFAYKDYARLVRVCRRFWTLCRSKEYWKWVGKYALKNILPAYVLQDVDFFHGLEPNDPPWGWLGSLVINNIHMNKTGRLWLVYYKNIDVMLRRYMSFSFESSIKYYSLGIYTGDLKFAIEHGTPFRVTYFKHPFLQKRTFTHAQNFCFNSYVEIWCPEKQKMWYGEPGYMSGYLTHETLNLLYPNEKSLGVWV